MNRLNELLQELGISKVRLAKYLGVSRQMVYNYLELDDINKWPKEKKILLYRLLDINDENNQTIDSIKVTTDYLMSVENRLNTSVKGTTNISNYFDLKNLNLNALVTTKTELKLIANAPIIGFNFKPKPE